MQGGNPNVNDVRTNLNNILLNKVAASNDKIKKKMIYKEMEHYFLYWPIIWFEKYVHIYHFSNDSVK